MAYALIANVAVQGAANGATTAAIDTTGADLVIVLLVRYAAVGAPTVTDSKSNTWQGLTTQTTTSDSACRILYFQGGTVGTNHTFSCTTSGTGTFSGLCVAAFSGSTASPFDVEDGNINSGSVTSLNVDDITPTQDNELVICGLSTNNNTNFATNASVDGGFTITNRINSLSGQSFAYGLAYLIQTTAATAGPTWSWSSGNACAGVIGSFKAAAGGGGGTTYPGGDGCGVFFDEARRLYLPDRFQRDEPLLRAA